MPTGSIDSPFTKASRSSSERTSIRSIWSSLRMRCRDCHRQSFQSLSGTSWIERPAKGPRARVGTAAPARGDSAGVGATAVALARAIARLTAGVAAAPFGRRKTGKL